MTRSVAGTSNGQMSLEKEVLLWVVLVAAAAGDTGQHPVVVVVEPWYLTVSLVASKVHGQQLERKRSHCLWMFTRQMGKRFLLGSDSELVSGLRPQRLHKPLNVCSRLTW